MKRFTRYAIGAIVVLGTSSAWAQQRDLEVTMDVVPANVSAGAAGEIKLPIKLPDTASARGQEASSFGLGTANLARDKAYPRRRKRTPRNPGARNALVPMNARPAGVHSGRCARLFVVEGRKGEKQAAFGFTASSSFYSSVSVRGSLSAPPRAAHWLPSRASRRFARATTKRRFNRSSMRLGRAWTLRVCATTSG